jgi:uncharacterized protein
MEEAMKLLTGLVLAVTLVPAAAAAQEAAEQPRTINVSANATVEREPDRAVVLLAVESEAATARDAAAANAQLMERVIAAVRQAGVRDEAVRTVSYEIRPEYVRADRDREPPRIASYRAINMVQVRVDAVQQAGSIIDAGLGAGANRVAGLRFELQDPGTARIEALREAMSIARREAEAIASAAGQRLGEPLTIHTGYAYAPPPSPMMGRAEMDIAAAPTPIEGGTLAVTATINAVYRILSP